jgi:hypothetical protein
MSEQIQSTKTVYARDFSGKLRKYDCFLSISVIEEGKYRIESFDLDQIENDEVVERIKNDLSKHEITYEIINDQQYLTQKGKKIRPIELGTLTVYPVVYCINNFNLFDCNIPCSMILDAIEKIPKQESKKETRGRHKKYLNDDERKEAQQRHALMHHYRKEALEKYLKSNPNDEIISVKVNVSSKVLGEFNEEITYKRLQDGSYRKIHK